MDTMNGNQMLDSELIKEGLGSYWDAKFAIRAFESTIREAAHHSLLARHADLQGICGAMEERKIEPITESDCRLGQVAVGALCPWDSGIRLGVAWRQSEEADGLQPIACLTIRSGALWRKERVLREFKTKLLATSESAIRVDAPQHSPYEVAVWMPLSPHADMDTFKSAISTVLGIFVEWSKAGGGLGQVAYGALPPTESK